MISRRKSLALVTLWGAVSLCAQPTAPTPPPEPISFQDAITRGKVSVNTRLRYEHVDQAGTADAEALTARLRIGYATQLHRGFQAMIEGEAATPLIKDYYDGTGTNASNYAVVADPEVYQVNQAWFAYTSGKTKGTLGRQKIVLDNARFVGDVSWRQNDQTFDAFVLQDKSLAKTTLTYAYLDGVNRIFDGTSAQPDWDSKSHLFNASSVGLPVGTLTAYAYLMEFDTKSLPARAGVRNQSNQTYGLSLAGGRPLSPKVKASYRFEYARQSDYGQSTLSHRSDYYLAELGAGFQTHSLALGYEVLGSDNNIGFRTPLATLHAFNGWADVFLATPAAGLTDTYVKVGTVLPRKIGLTAFYHVFGTDNGPSQLGREADLVMSYQLNKRISFTVKGAKFWSDQAGFAARTKLWFQADVAF
jgi:hypothetical protein